MARLKSVILFIFYGMKKIQMVDLVSQYENIKPSIDAAMHEVVTKAQFINGPEVQAFQRELEEYLQVKHVIPCANGTDALQMAMMGLGLKPGDEVITPSFRWILPLFALILRLLNLPSLPKQKPLCRCICTVKQRTWKQSWPLRKSTALR